MKNILYNEHGQRTEIDYGNNVVTKYAYDDENLRLKTIETTKGGRTIQSLTYDYDERLCLKIVYEEEISGSC